MGRIRNWVTAAAVGGAAVTALALATPAGATPVSHASRATIVTGTPQLLTGSALQQAMKRQGNWNIKTQNGSHLCINAPNLSVGTQTTQGTAGNCRTLHDFPIAQDPNGYEEVYWENTAGNFLAANNNCNAVPWKANASDNGTVWIEYVTGNADYLVSRFCSGGIGHYTNELGGTDHAGERWYVVPHGAGGYFTKVLYVLI
jgi:hypothetical protein